MGLQKAPFISDSKWELDGRFWAYQGKKTFLKGVTYGPFPPQEGDLPEGGFRSKTQQEADFSEIKEAGFQVVRLYQVPKVELLDRLESIGLGAILGVPWGQDYVGGRNLQRWQHARERMRDALAPLVGHPAVRMVLVGNEIQSEIVRWTGPRRVERFLESLMAEVHDLWPDIPVSYANYPPTQWLAPRGGDVSCWNVYLEDREKFSAYLKHLHSLAGNLPLLLTEFGRDVQRSSEREQAHTLQWAYDEAMRGGAAGLITFSWSDLWWRGGELVQGWSFGLKDAQDVPRPALHAIQQVNAAEEVGRHRARQRTFSVVICSRNGGASLERALHSLQGNFGEQDEVLVVDDGSEPSLQSRVTAFPGVRYIRQAHAGLSAARNLGWKESRGEIIAYIDDDCQVHSDWLGWLDTAYDNEDVVAAGGPNLPPPPRNEIERWIAMAPGSPMAVLLNDEEAEHLPGCNLSIRKTALENIGGFREEFRVAGDDVDVCWRLRQAGGKLAYVPAAFVWHQRRDSVRAYLRQQAGYGKAEAWLRRIHPERFSAHGCARWQGVIYDPALTLLGSGVKVDQGLGGSQLFPGVYGGISRQLTQSLREAWTHPQSGSGKGRPWWGKFSLFFLTWMQFWVRERARRKESARLGLTVEPSFFWRKKRKDAPKKPTLKCLEWNRLSQRQEPVRGQVLEAMTQWVHDQGGVWKKAENSLRWDAEVTLNGWSVHVLVIDEFFEHQNALNVRLGYSKKCRRELKRWRDQITEMMIQHTQLK